MKKVKIASIILSVMLLATVLTGCGGGKGGAAEVVTGTKSVIEFSTIEQGDLAVSSFGTLTIYSDNTYMYCGGNHTYYSSDGGETYTPNVDIEAILYGKYEVTEENTELGERTIKITSIDRLVSADYDSAAKGDDLNSTAVIGSEVILTNTHELSDFVDLMPLLDFFYVSPY